MAIKPIQFLDAKRKDEAIAIWYRALRLEPLGAEDVPLEEALGRVLASDVVAPIDVPPFDRSIVDGYAVIAADTFGAGDASPARLRLMAERVLAGVARALDVRPGTAVEIATGGLMPRGADAVQMVERTDLEGDDLLVHQAVVPGAHIQAAGSDLRLGDVVLARGIQLTSRETGVLAALGLAQVSCHRQPRVAVFSTGDELVRPGEPLAPGLIYDSNARAIGDALRENGARVEFLGIVPDDESKLRTALQAASAFDVVVLSGGTSKGTGDLSFHLIDEMGSPGILVHGVQLKPGKPVVLAAWDGKPVVVLPGFPTSAVLTFHLFVRPVVRRLGGLSPEPEAAVVEATLPQRVHSAAGRYEYLLVHLVRGSEGELIAYPVPKSSGSISAFAEADGYLEVPESRDLLLAGERARVTLMTSSVRPADLVFIGSLCVALDGLLATLRREQGIVTKVLNLGSSGGVQAALRGEADVAGVHLLDAAGSYNREALAEAGPGVVLVRGYRRRQGLVYRAADFTEPPRLEDLVLSGRHRIINRPRGAGTRVLLDHLLAGIAATSGLGLEELRARIPGFGSETRSHGAVAAAVAAGRADFGIAVQSAARASGLGFTALRDEEYDLLIPRRKLGHPAVAALLAGLGSVAFRAALADLEGFAATSDMGQVVAGAE